MDSILNEQWKEIIENDPFSENAEILLTTGESFAVSGIYYSGSYQENRKTPYAPTKWERQDWFQISLYSLPSEICGDPSKFLRNAQIEVENRGIFKIHEVKGANSGMLTIFIQPKEFNREF